MTASAHGPDTAPRSGAAANPFVLQGIALTGLAMVVASASLAAASDHPVVHAVLIDWIVLSYVLNGRPTPTGDHG